MKIYQAIIANSITVDQAASTKQRLEQAKAMIKKIEKMLPHGSGFDSGTKIIDATSQRIIFETAFHHMDDNGYYCGWTEHRVTVKADLLYGYIVRVSGVNKRGIKEYIQDVFCEILDQEFTD